MTTLLKQVTIADPQSPLNGNVADILIEDGIIQKIDTEIQDAADVVEDINALASPGWVDVFAHACDPGYEYRETLESCADAAAAGGYTNVFILPDTNPVLQSKSQVEYIVRKAVTLPALMHPLGSVSKNAEGKDLAEMYDMRNSGAVAFTDGLQSVQSPGLLLKALQYVKAFNGVVIQLPYDATINAHGLVTEGIISAQLGLPGIPALSEELMVMRDIELAKYADSSLHITGVSTINSVNLIKKAKTEGAKITCSVTPYHLFFCDEDLVTYDTNLKVNPPLRSRMDMMALRKAIEDGEIDCIASHHLPQNWDAKTCEFEYAKKGMIGLQTAFSVIQTVLPGLSTQKLVDLFSLNARKIFRLGNGAIREGSRAELTFFNRDDEFTLSKQNNKSISANTPFMDETLKGKTLGTFVRNSLHLNK